MAWFQLDTQSVVERVKAAARPVALPCLGTSLCRGIVGFTLLGVAGFAPWAIWGRWFYRNVGEVGLYVTCALAFIGLSGPLLHRLVLGSGSLPRFYKLFGITFAANSVLWIVGWMALRGHPGSLAGLLAGTAAMGWMMARAFDAKEQTLKVIAALFVLNSIGYFVGGWCEEAVVSRTSGSELARTTQVALAKLLWGVCYGVGFGAGLGLAFHFCQGRTRAALADLQKTPAGATTS